MMLATKRRVMYRARGPDEPGRHAIDADPARSRYAPHPHRPAAVVAVFVVLFSVTCAV